MYRDDNTRAVVLGQSGTGKTTYSRSLLRLSKKPWVAVTDDVTDYIRVLPPTGRLIRISTPVPAKVLIPLLDRPVLIEITGYVETEIPAIMTGIANAVSTVQERLVVIDEAHIWYPRQGVRSLALTRLLTGGRHQGIDWVMVTQHATEVHILALKAARFVVSFRVNEQNDVRRVARFLQVDERRVTSLPQGHYVLRDHRTGSMNTGTVTLGK